MRESYVRKLVKLVEESDIGSLEVSFSPFGLKLSRLKIDNRFPKTIEKKVQIVEKKPEPATIVKEYRFIGHEYDYIKANHPALFYFNEDKSGDESFVPFEKREEIKKGQVLGYLFYLEHMNPVVSHCDGYILRPKAKNGKVVGHNTNLFLIYVKKLEKPPKPEKPRKPKIVKTK